MTIETTGRSGSIDIAATRRGGIEYPLNHLMDAAGATIDPATEATAAAILAAARENAAVGIRDGVNVDAFSRLRVSDPQTLFAAQCQYDADPLLFETGGTGTGSAGVHSAATRMVALTCTAGSGTSYIQSHEYIPYQPGKSQLVLCTGVLGAGVAGHVVDFGLFDGANGFFLRQNGASGLQLVRRTSTSGSMVEEAVDQADWNKDRMDGTGLSGITLDPAMSMILVIDGQFLGMGRGRVYFDIDGMLIEVHHFKHANVIAVPYMQTLSLPVQMLVTSTASAAPKTAHFKCASVSSEGGLSEDIGFQFATLEQAVTAASGADTHILGLRPLTTFNSITNRMRIALNSLELLVTGTNSVHWKLAVGSAFSASATWGAVNATYSGAEQTTAVGTVSSVGTVIAAGYVAASANSKTVTSARLSQRYPISLNRAGAVRANGTLHLFVKGVGGNSACRAVVNFSEVR